MNVWTMVAVAAVLAVSVGMLGWAGESGTTMGLPEGAIARLDLVRVYSLSYSPDGRWLALGTSNGIELREAQSLRLVTSLTGHVSAVLSVAFSPDGKLLASGSEDETIRVWDSATGLELRCLTGHRHWVRSVMFSPDGAVLASGAWPEVKLWDLSKGRGLQTLAGRRWDVFSVAFSPDGRILAAGLGNNKIKLWDVATGAELRTLAGHTDWVRSVAFSPDGRLLASGSDDRTIKVWDAASGAEFRTLAGGQTVAWAWLRPVNTPFWSHVFSSELPAFGTAWRTNACPFAAHRCSHRKVHGRAPICRLGEKNSRADLMPGPSTKGSDTHQVPSRVGPLRCCANGKAEPPPRS